MSRFSATKHPGKKFRAVGPKTMMFRRTISMNRRNPGIILCIATISICALLHTLSFLMAVPFLLILAPFGLLGGSILCATPTPLRGWRNPTPPRGRTAVIGWVLLIYAVMLFVHFYRSSGGASSVGIIEGHYVYMSKDTVIRPISEQEFKMFPTQVARIMSAWLAMMATFCLSSIIHKVNDQSVTDDPNSTP